MACLLLALLGGSLTALACPKADVPLLAWFSLIPLLVAWRRAASWKGAFAAGWAAGIAFHGVAIYWVYPTARFAGIGAGIGLLGWGAMALFMGLPWGVVGGLGWRLAPQAGPGPWAWAAVWTAVSAAAAWWGPRPSLDLLAFTQGRSLALLQVAAVAGPHALGFLVVAVNAVVLELWEERTRSVPNTALALALLAGVWGYGTYELTRRDWLSRQGAERTRLELVQPSIDQYHKWDAAFESEIVRVYESLLSRPREARPDLVVWPESALPWVLREGEQPPLVSDWARRLSVPQLAGVLTEGKDGLRRCTAVLVDADGRVVGAYHKRQLVPFGEWVPFSFLARYIGYLSVLGDLAPGRDVQPLLATPLGAAAVTICYEATFPRWARLDASRGARTIINLTNDGWYKDTWAPYQHFYVNVFRAIENRATVVRCGNTGISGVIDPWGVVTARLGLGERGRLDASAPKSDPFPGGSLYSRLGDWFGAACVAAVIAFAFARWRPAAR